MPSMHGLELKTTSAARRFKVQLASTLAANSHLTGLLQSRIYRGPAKAVCVPFLNCYSCPAAWGSCPVGAFQSLAAGFGQRLSLYISGLLVMVGALAGRFVCGWLCPFGLFQELLFKVKTKKRRLWPAVRYVQYIILAVTIALPFVWRPVAQLALPYYCQFVCPAGTLEAGLLLAARSSALRQLMGPVFWFKAAIAVGVIFTAMVIWRPFCQTLCPLGAFYGLFNRVSLWRMNLNQASCVGCGACARACPAGLVPHAVPNSAACLRCLQCTAVCPTGALTFGPVTTLSSRPQQL